MNNAFSNNHCQGEEKLMMEIEGIISAISTSKIKKIIVIKKKWREKGRREEDFWSKPHSKGDSFSRSKLFFFAIIIHRVISKLAIIKTVIKEIYIVIINYKIITYY